MINKRIHEHAKLHIDGDFPYAYAQRWLIEAQNIIASMCETGRILDEYIIENAEKDTWYDLPNNLIEMNRVYDEDNRETIDFTVDSGRIKFKKDGTYKIEYKRVPAIKTKETDEPELHELYHYPMSYWLASKEQFRYNPDSPDGQRLSNEFYMQIQQVDNTLRKNRKKKRYIKV